MKDLENRLGQALNTAALKYYGLAAKSEPGAARAAMSIVAGALLELKGQLDHPQSGDGAATPPADPAEAPAPTGGEQADESATGGSGPSEPAPSPSYSEDAVIRAYALGVANSHGRLTPTAPDWAMARSWWGA